ncbi:MAG: hypothetical protein OXH66_03460 [Gemmatimonadetes bacterium]|nr:hypothetical protein [Gemmatimonadota bacterium]
MDKDSDWRAVAVRWIAGTIIALILAGAVLIGLHEDPASLDEPIEAVFDGIVRVLTLMLGAGGVAVGAYQSGRTNGKQGQSR